jgi:hypothetical protein
MIFGKLERASANTCWARGVKLWKHSRHIFSTFPSKNLPDNVGAQVVALVDRLGISGVLVAQQKLDWQAVNQIAKIRVILKSLSGKDPSDKVTCCLVFNKDTI